MLDADTSPPPAVFARLDTRCVTWPAHPRSSDRLDRCGTCDGCVARRWERDVAAEER